jgi:DNA-binding transcriptional regulator GbsR (MarR family)
MMELNEKTRDFIERMGLTFEHMGATRTMGRLMGLLLVADKPLSLNELVSLLQVSKATVSTNARLTDQLGLTQRVSIPGDRRDFYQILPGAFERAAARRMAAIHQLIELSQQGLEAIEQDNDTARARLQTMQEFYQFFLTEMDSALAKWKKKQHRDE